MSNYYNNNNQGIYGNQNQYRPNQNNFAGPNYMPPSGTSGTIYSKFNQQNYNQGNNYNQNQNNVGPMPFISGHIGCLLISSEDIDTFSKSLRTTEWTNNPNYLQAKNIDVKMKISLKGGRKAHCIVFKKGMFS